MTPARPRLARSSSISGWAAPCWRKLALARRIHVDASAIRVTGREPTGDAICDSALATIAEDRKSRKPADWVPRLSRGLRGVVLSRLTAKGIVRKSEQKVLGFIPVTRYPAVDARIETDLRERLRAVVVAGAPPDPRTAALCGLALAIGMERALFPDIPRKDVEHRFEEVAASEWAGPVSDAVAAAQEVAAAVSTAVVVTIVVTGNS